MGTDVITTEENDTAKPEKETDKQNRPGRWLSIVTLILLVLVIVDSVYFYMQIESLQSGTDKQSGQLQGQLDSTTQQLSRLQQQTDTLAAELQGTNAQLDKLSLNFSELYQRNNSDVGWTLAEVKYLLVVASHRLVLEKDVSTALVALQTADQRLRQMPDPALVTVREQLIAAINDLKAAEQIDTTGLSLFLTDLAKRAENLPLNKLIEPETEAAETEIDGQEQKAGWERLAGSVWQELKSLVDVSEIDAQAVATLLPEQRYFLYQNLRLQLESARLAVLLKDEATFKESVQLVINWLQQYFDTTDNDVGAALDSLEHMLAVDFDYSVPSISDTINTLDEYINSVTDESLSQSETVSE